MASDLQILSDKIAQLAELTQQLRRENADLRLRVASLTADKTDLAARMQQAAQRVTALMEKLPTPTTEEEAS
ncbi:MAG: DUF904 domain-containing protein [Burkholderiaceae bacterium]|nr:DUF904 domain-containing protein [Burkholderiaceae bacterium]